jgi:hypothetical protein
MTDTTLETCLYCKTDLTYIRRVFGKEGVQYHLFLHEKQHLQAKAYQEGYFRALEDYSLWKDGVQRIGAMCTDIKDIKERFVKDPRNNPYLQE